MINTSVKGSASMSIFEIKTIKNNKDTNAVIGDNNVALFSQLISEIKKTNITSQSKYWKYVFKQITSMQKVVNGIPDEHEDIRDQQLVPALSKAKAEATKLAQDPHGEKSGFLSSFKVFVDLANSVVTVGGKVAPFVVAIAKVIGVTLV